MNIGYKEIQTATDYTVISMLLVVVRESLVARRCTLLLFFFLAGRLSEHIQGGDAPAVNCRED